MRCSRSVCNIVGVIILRRLMRFDGALVIPKRRRFDRMEVMVRQLLPATEVISVFLSVLLRIMSRISWCWEAARFGAIFKERVLEDLMNEVGKDLEVFSRNTGECTLRNM